MTFDLLVITTTNLEKQKTALQTIKSIEEKKFPFSKKIISIDDFGNDIYDDLKNYLYNNDWVVDLHPRVGMCENIKIGLNHCTSEWILYSEDDVIVNGLPSVKDFDEIKKNIDRELGILSLLSSRGTGFLNDKFDVFKREILDNRNYINSENYSVWVRNDFTIDDFFIEFPITFINKELFLNLFNYAYNNLGNIQIEMGLTKAFIDGGFKEKYKKVNYLRPINLSAIEHLNYWDIMDYITKNHIFILNKDNHNGDNLSYSVNGGKFFKLKDW